MSSGDVSHFFNSESRQTNRKDKQQKHKLTEENIDDFTAAVRVDCRGDPHRQELIPQGTLPDAELGDIRPIQTVDTITPADAVLTDCNVGPPGDDLSDARPLRSDPDTPLGKFTNGQGESAANRRKVPGMENKTTGSHLRSDLNSFRSRVAVEETIPLQGPVSDDRELIHHTHRLAPTDVLEVPGVVVDLVFRGEETIDVTDGIPERSSDRRLPRPPLVLLHEVQTQDRAPVALEEIAEVLPGREMDRIHLCHEDRGASDHRITLLRPEERDART